jgi:hypothetical protein
MKVLKASKTYEGPSEASPKSFIGLKAGNMLESFSLFIRRRHPWFVSATNPLPELYIGVVMDIDVDFEEILCDIVSKSPQLIRLTTALILTRFDGVPDFILEWEYLQIELSDCSVKELEVVSSSTGLPCSKRGVRLDYHLSRISEVWWFLKSLQSSQ